MTLTKYNGQYEELFSSAVLWWTGSDQTSLGFPILPAGVTVTPNGTWSNDLDLGTNRIVKRFTRTSNNYVSISDHSDWNFGSGNVSICYWMYLISINTSQENGVLSQRWAYNSNRSLYHDIHPDRYLHCMLTDSTGAVAMHTVDTIQFPLTTWTFVSSIRNGDTLYYYRDGNLISSSTSAGLVVYDSSRPLIIGNVEAGASPLSQNAFDGYFKDLIIFKGRALTQPEIIALMKKTHPTNAIGDFRPTLSGIRGVE